MEFPSFDIHASSSMQERIDAFIEWGEPGGTAGIEGVHDINYIPEMPYFAWGLRFLGKGDASSRALLIKGEYLRDSHAVQKRSRNGQAFNVKNPNGFITDLRFLRFAKAYINVVTFYRQNRTPNRLCVKAIIFVEQALRQLNDACSDPINLKRQTFERASKNLNATEYAVAQKSDIGREIEIFASMLQRGYRSANTKLDGMGFLILQKPFSFSAGFPILRRPKALYESLEEQPTAKNRRLTTEVVAAVGLAYRKSKSLDGDLSPATFMAAAAGLVFTAASLRPSDLALLRRNSVSLADATGRYKLRVERPKIATHQLVPIPRVLSELVLEILASMKHHSQDAHDAFTFYVDQFGDDFSSIDTLFIPDRFQTIFQKHYLNWEDLNILFDTNHDSIWGFQSLPHIIYTFVDSPDDLWNVKVGDHRKHKGGNYFKIADIQQEFSKHGVEFTLPCAWSPHEYVNKMAIVRSRPHNDKILDRIWEDLFQKRKPLDHYVKTSELSALLLSQFKKATLPHWPYVTKEKSTRLDEALMVWSSPGEDNRPTDLAKGKWWRPGLVPDHALIAWLSGGRNKNPILFEKLGIRLKSGSFPSLTIHQTRKYHHTAALLAGANPLIIDELAGRQTGAQSDYYDLRTAHEIVTQSLETFDPDEDFSVAGPIAKRMEALKIVDRKTFLYENSAPKHLTEIGGCTTDWSLEPCDQYGSCTRCDKHVWRKGDKKRLLNVIEKREHAIDMILVAEKKAIVQDLSHSFSRQLQQFKDDLARCDAILDVERDPLYEVGTLVTFELSKDAEGFTQWASRLREDLSKIFVVAEKRRK